MIKRCTKISDDIASKKEPVVDMQIYNPEIQSQSTEVINALDKLSDTARNKALHLLFGQLV